MPPHTHHPHVTGRGKCGGKCKELMAHGSLRFGSVGEIWGSTQTFYRHWTCVTDRQIGNCETSRNIAGMENLSPLDLRRVLGRFGELHLLPEYGDHDPPGEAECAPGGSAKKAKAKKAKKKRGARAAREEEGEEWGQHHNEYTPAAPGLSDKAPSLSDATITHLMLRQPLADVVVCITGNSPLPLQ